MYYLDYKYDKHMLGAMMIFAFSQFDHSLDFDITSDRLRVYFRDEMQQSFFAMNFSDWTRESVGHK